MPGSFEKLLTLFNRHLEAKGYISGGQIVDATIVAAPKQHNKDEEKKAIKDGRIPAGWKDKPAKLAQKDRDARWTVKYTKARPREGGMPHARRQQGWPLTDNYLGRQVSSGGVSRREGRSPDRRVTPLDDGTGFTPL